MSGDRICDIWGPRTPHTAGTPWPERVDQFLIDGVGEADVDTRVRGACLLCSNGCGLEVAVRGGRMVGVRGRAEGRGRRGAGPRPGPPGRTAGAVPERLHPQGISVVRTVPAGLLRDLQDLYQFVSLVDITWSLVKQAGQALRDGELLRVIDDCAVRTTAQLDWLRMRMKAAAPQTLLVAS
ncbi:hypothetical protein ABZ484_36110 [Streptomyces sp. NPDC006393]|uniref:hypothetical protein n=1 Tax=Streptomyces sp. NPDC006393 TaxID=3156763 RepID=UPI003407D34D